MPLSVPQAALDHLNAAPLKVAVAQVRYSPVHAVARRDLVAEFEGKLDKRYVAQPAQTPQALTIQFGAGPGQGMNMPPPGLLAQQAQVDTVWPFRDEERGYAVSLGNSALAVEADSTYHDFPQFLNEFRTAVAACTDVFHPKREIRLGVRYINEISDEGLRQDIRAVINPELAQPVGTAIQGGLLQSFSELRVEEELGTFVVRHGLVEEGATYLLDLDYFSETERDFDPDRVIESVQGLHDLIEAFFVWSLNPKYLTKLQRRRKPKKADDSAV
jgi:uncharacterized protein (TIGR04255 family)